MAHADEVMVAALTE
jgi:hypothetical protein